MSRFEVVDPTIEFYFEGALGPEEASENFFWNRNDSEEWLERGKKRHGLCRLFQKKPFLQATSYYWEGQLHGPSRYFHSNGQCLAHSFFIEGKRWGPALFWYPSGKIAKELHYKEDLLHGLQRYFSEKGFLRTELSYFEGRADGAFSEFHSFSQPSRVMFFKEGRKEGEEKLWYFQGEAKMRRFFSKGEPVGQSHSWYPSGQLAEEIEYLGAPWKFHLHRYASSGDLLLEGLSLDGGVFEEKKYDRKRQLLSHKRCWRDSFGKVLHEEWLKRSCF